ncbi:MAG: hypothetical protein HFP77_06750 [Methylococcales symbiont of Iophon sp. n. MRB-2018]|nr:MAG: hypothetical protein HFP77_06750 [Methylococcales symbiont of Iophon sp. n. MRB-2018]KAF3979699.1 MAG: hypothetical protein HFP76_06120 [Methylococcales symbiont of Iophon sp. n. MRB-2018]
MRETIKTGVKAGLADARAAKGQELTTDYIDDLKIELQARINSNKMFALDWQRFKYKST